MKHQYLFIAALSVAVASGCASDGSESPTRSAEEVAADVGFSIGGMEPGAGKTGALQRAIEGDEGKLEEDLAATQQRVAQLEQTLLTAAATEQPGTRQIERRPIEATGPRTKLGVVYTDEGPASALLQRLLAAASNDYPVTVADNAAVARELEKTGCTALAGDCLKALSVYPGVQLLVVVRGFQGDGAKSLGSVELLDPVTGIKLQTLSAELPAVQGQVPPQSLEALADRLLFATVSQAANIPWSTRAFSQEGDRLYLSAGKESGLKSGDVLEVHSPGNWLRSPSGSPVAWIPGVAKGLLRVDTLVGADVAAVTLIQGQAPTPNDPLTLRAAP